MNTRFLTLALLMASLAMFSACSSQQSAQQQEPPTTTSTVRTEEVPATEAGESNNAQRNTYGGGHMGQYEGTGGRSNTDPYPNPSQGGSSAPSSSSPE